MRNTASEYDAIIVGSGPNGLSAGILLAQNGLSVKIIEAKDTIGGGTRTQELTEPGFLHDVCSAVHPTAASSPFLSSLPLHKYGLEFIQPEVAAAHPLEHGKAVIAYQSLEKTLEGFGADAKHYSNLVSSFSNDWKYLAKDLFGTLRNPNHPLLMARFGWYGMMSTTLLANSMFDTEEVKAYFAGMAAHSILPLEKAFTASFGLVLVASLHAVGWPIAKGGSAKIAQAMGDFFKELGGEIETGNEIKELKQLPSSKVVLFDLTPYQIAKILGNHLPLGYKKQLENYKYGPGAFKIDIAMSEPVPWANPDARKAGTLHLGGTLEELAYSEAEIWKGNHPEKPYVLVSQPSVFDDTRAPEGKHTLWSYCHVPNGSTKDCTDEILNQIERYAPGFRDTIISYSTMTAVQMNEYNANYIGGDINGGAQYVKQLFGRPVLKWNPYKMPVPGFYICSASTPPGGGVHGMSGYNAAKSALKKEFGIRIK